MTKQRVPGRVIDATSRRPLGELRVEAWDSDPRHGALLGLAVTDREGRFTIELDARRAAGSDGRRPEIYFKVFRGDRLLADTRSQVVWSPQARDARVIIPVRDGPADPALD